VFSEIISIGGKNWEIGRKKDIGEGSGEKKKHSTPSPPMNGMMLNGLSLTILQM
jgi:hypothetical protein